MKEKRTSFLAGIVWLLGSAWGGCATAHWLPGWAEFAVWTTAIVGMVIGLVAIAGSIVEVMKKK